MNSQNSRNKIIASSMTKKKKKGKKRKNKKKITQCAFQSTTVPFALSELGVL